MKKRNVVFLLAIGCAAVSAQAATVVYTDSQHPPAGLGAGHQVVYLDAPEVVQREVFGALSADPRQAEQQAKTVLQSPDWQQKEQQIVQAYHGVIQAYDIGLKKYPAVVFDDRYVVYGTADVALAEVKLAEHKGAQ
ncbi:MULTISPECIES: TIGR03757 family integrating conjugative element protein [Serratia]|jgi:integrating conjugative element protein (TIGR03757 family)|uniref:TIGR03757 family integrating conjugative element protein n=1 Tax=Serratia TaxID=613 RepID=UPI001A20D691|nr:TIGR03757 family integrating conjugative element protein [Serratia liquefaciens]EKN4905983.1 TIGR03757 family integrating conjugative element protein [Yersinia enterocolitica]HAT3731585.1 TIGR03757 family integrating conjugative element protein [Serratia marcescens]HDM8374048.1 TIGR03757 family integrating conjugative element protein [Yersinia enterocolitica]HEN3244244.1 TIGR03757 family integrating conjugative element protein [Yersinia enterocolitica]HEN3450957.1 TIGR03757 family integrati